MGSATVVGIGPAPEGVGLAKFGIRHTFCGQSLSMYSGGFMLIPTIAQAGLFAGFGALMVFFVILGIIASVFWVWMLIDALTSSMETNEKILWFCVIFFLHLLGAIIYYFVKKSDRHRPHAA
jgi:hypothetical protein